MRYSHAWRGLSILVGFSLAGLGAYGSYEYHLKLEGSVSYLVIAAPAIALAAVLIPPMAETAWRQGQWFKALLWWLVLIPAAATVFYSAAERVHIAKSGAEAERSALRSAAQRAKDELAEAKSEYEAATREADRTKGLKTCNTTCEAKRSRAQRATERLEKAKVDLLSADTKATTESALKPTPWLLPMALDLTSFMSIWWGLTSRKKKRKRPANEVLAGKRRRSKAKARPAKKPTEKPGLKVVNAD